LIMRGLLETFKQNQTAPREYLILSSISFFLSDFSHSGETV